MNRPIPEKRRSHGRPAVLAAVFCLVGLLLPGRPASASPPDLEAIRRLNQVGRFAEAEKAARALLAETERRAGPESLEAAEALDELAVALRRGGKAGDAESRVVCERALRIKEHAVGETDARYASSLYNLGLLFYQRGEFDSAAVPLGRALEIRERTLGANHRDVAMSLLAMGSVQEEQGDFRSARLNVERATRIQMSVLAPGDPERAYGLNALGSLEYETGALSEAISAFEEANALWERSPTPNLPILGNNYHNLGCVYSEIGDHEKALQTLREALRLREESLGRNHPLVAATLAALGDEVSRAGDPPAARAYLERALRVQEQAYGPDHPSVGFTRMKLGLLHLTAGDLPRAATLLRSALKVQERALGPEHPNLWQTLLGLADVARRQGDLTGARRYYERALEILAKAYGPSNIDLGGSLTRYAGFLLQARDSAAALDVSLRAAQVNGEQLRLISHGLAERQALLYASTLGTSLDVALAVLAGGRYRGDPSAIREVWNALIRWRTLVLDEVASRNRSVSAAEGLAEKARRLEAARQRLANLLVRGPESERPDRYRALVESARDEMERAERDLGATSAAFRSDRDRGQVGLPEVLSAIPPATALVAYAGYDTPAGRSTLAFVLGRTRQPAAIPLGPVKEIDRLVGRWASLAGSPPARSGAAARAAERDCRAAGEKLRARIWDPLGPYIQDASRILVVPEGSLHLVNLAALPVGASEYLVESGALIHYLSAERDLVRTALEDATGEGLLAIGGPSFDSPEARSAPDSRVSRGAADAPAAEPAERVFRSAPSDCAGFRSARFEPLPASVREVRDIAALWAEPGEALVLTGSAASEGAFKRLAPGHRVIHLATHGFFLNGRCGTSPPGAERTRGIGGVAPAQRPAARPAAEENPLLLSGVALAGANRRGSARADEEDGILTAEEIASVDLSRVEWAVLSACDTGLGEIQAGEGVLGLRRAFLAAGASTLIMSLWSVEDRSARDWMSALYEAKFRGKLETDEAVRRADLGVLRERRARAAGTHPFYWAGFVAAGDWR